MKQENFIAPSILSADFAKLGDEVDSVLVAGADIVHFDVMDNHYVPNLTIGPDVIKKIRPFSRKIFDVHLMISPVDKYIEQFAHAGADIITFHPEATEDTGKTIELIRKFNKKVGISLKPKSKISLIKDYLDKIIVCSLFLNSILIAIILSQTSHKLMPTIIIGLLITIGLKITKKVWND